MEMIEGSETSAISTQTPGNYPKENILHIEHDKSLKSRKIITYLLTYSLTYSMVQSPSWAANWFATSQEIPRISRNPKVHYRTHKRPPTVSILGQANPVHIPTSHLLEIRPNIIHPSTLRSPQWSLSLRFPHPDPIHPPLLTHTLHMPSPILSIYPHHTSWRSVLILSTHEMGNITDVKLWCTPGCLHLLYVSQMSADGSVSSNVMYLAVASLTLRLMKILAACRCFAILRPMANVVNVARRGKIMLVVAWTLATLCSVPQVRAYFAD